MLTHFSLILTLYLLAGTFVMLAVNELLDGAVTRKEFLLGMLLWPAILAAFIGALAVQLWQGDKRRG